MVEEVRTTSATGAEKGQKPCQLSSLPPHAMEQLGAVYGYGASKYAPHNYRKGYEVSKSVDALFRHVLRFLDGQDLDEESNLSHMAHASWHCLNIIQTLHDHPAYDDRYKPPSRPLEFDGPALLARIMRHNDLAYKFTPNADLRTMPKTYPHDWNNPK